MHAVPSSGVSFNHCLLPPQMLSSNIYKKPIFLTMKKSSTVRGRPIRASTVSVRSPAAPESLYETLGVSEKGSLVDIKQAYRQLARKYHPDVVSRDRDRVDEFTRRFIRIQEAYETLSDPKTRAMYDRDMATGLHLAFDLGARKRTSGYPQEMEMDAVRGDWKSRWESQLDGLRRKSHIKNTVMSSWGARMRKQKAHNI